MDQPRTRGKRRFSKAFGDSWVSIELYFSASASRQPDADSGDLLPDV